MIDRCVELELLGKKVTLVLQEHQLVIERAGDDDDSEPYFRSSLFEDLSFQNIQPLIAKAMLNTAFVSAPVELDAPEQNCLRHRLTMCCSMN